MKKKITFLILTYLLFTINSVAISQDTNKNILENKEILKIGVLLPLSGEFQDIGQSFLRAIQLALYDIENKKIKIYPKDSKGSALGTYKSAKEFEEMGIEIVLGPIFYQALEKLEEFNNITFISFTNNTSSLPKNIIAFGVNINSQIDALKNYFNEIKNSKTLLLSPKTQYIDQTKIIEESGLKFYRVFFYDTNPKKITSDIEKLTKYHERKKDLERRIKILEKSDLYKDKKELKKLEQKHTLGRVNFDSVVVVDFGERLKSVLTSFIFSDVSTEKVNFFTLNQWFDETLFGENALQNLHFPAIDLNNLTKFKEKYINIYREKPNKVSILAYDALGLIYYCWFKNDNKFNSSQLYSEDGFRGLHGEFIIKKGISRQKLQIYKIAKEKFIKVY